MLRKEINYVCKIIDKHEMESKRNRNILKQRQSENNKQYLKRKRLQKNGQEVLEDKTLSSNQSGKKAN